MGLGRGATPLVFLGLPLGMGYEFNLSCNFH
jgi:hypothetical protein